MAHADFIEFLSRLAGDETLRERVDAVGASTDGAVDRLIGIAAEEGLSFTESEIDELVLAHAAADGELALEQLGRLSGGTTLAEPSGELLEMSESYDLQLQQGMQLENRHYTTISNILKTKYDATRNTIDNAR